MSHYFAVDYGKADRMLGDLRYESGSVSLGEFALNDPAETPKKRKAFFLQLFIARTQKEAYPSSSLGIPQTRPSKQLCDVAYRHQFTCPIEQYPAFLTRLSL